MKQEAIEPQPRTRVLIVDDSAVIRSLLKRRLNQHPRISVVGAAADAFDAHDKIRALKPDVLTLDVEMPRMDGLTFLRILMARHPMPVIILSSITKEGSRQAIEALRRGAVDVVAKPAGAAELNDLFEDLPEKILAAAAAQVTAIDPETILPRPPHVPRWEDIDPDRIILLGASTGGTEALRTVLSSLPADVPPILVVQHIPAAFSGAFAERLNDLCAMEVKEAKHHDLVIPGRVLIAPGGFHMSLHRSSASELRVELDTGAKIRFQRPAADRLFASAVSEAPHVIAGIMTGMGDDGAEALLKLRQAGARTIGQDEASCVVYGMPRVAHALGACEAMVPLSDFARMLLNLLDSNA